MQHHNQPCDSHIPQIHFASWKSKIAFLESLSQQIANKQLAFSPQLLEATWPAFIKEHNLNVLSKAINTLRLWVDTYGIRGLRIQRELIKGLISLSKMGRAELDSGIISIFISLVARQKQLQSSDSRVPLAILTHTQFNSHNNPTFLVGLQQSKTMQEAQIQNQYQTSEAIKHISQSKLLGYIFDCMRSCQKNSFLICLKIIDSLAKDNLLSKMEFLEIRNQAEKIREVIAHRRFTNSHKDKQIDSQIFTVLQKLEKIQL